MRAELAARLDRITALHSERHQALLEVSNPLRKREYCSACCWTRVCTETLSNVAMCVTVAHVTATLACGSMAPGQLADSNASTNFLAAAQPQVS